MNTSQGNCINHQHQLLYASSFYHERQHQSKQFQIQRRYKDQHRHQYHHQQLLQYPRASNELTTPIAQFAKAQISPPPSHYRRCHRTNADDAKANTDAFVSSSSLPRTCQCGRRRDDDDDDDASDCLGCALHELEDEDLDFFQPQSSSTRVNHVAAAAAIVAATSEDEDEDDDDDDALLAFAREALTSRHAASSSSTSSSSAVVVVGHGGVRGAENESGADADADGSYDDIFRTPLVRPAEGGEIVKHEGEEDEGFSDHEDDFLTAIVSGSSPSPSLCPFYEEGRERGGQVPIDLANKRKRARSAVAGLGPAGAEKRQCRRDRGTAAGGGTKKNRKQNMKTKQRQHQQQEEGESSFKLPPPHRSVALGVSVKEGSNGSSYVASFSREINASSLPSLSSSSTTAIGSKCFPALSIHPNDKMERSFYYQAQAQAHFGSYASSPPSKTVFERDECTSFPSAALALPSSYGPEKGMMATMATSHANATATSENMAVANAATMRRHILPAISAFLIDAQINKSINNNNNKSVNRFQKNNRTNISTLSPHAPLVTLNNCSPNDVIAVNKNDVICGSGVITNSMIGNRRYRVLIDLHARSYYDASGNGKRLDVARSVVRTIRSSVPSGRFLKLAVDVDNDAAAAAGHGYGPGGICGGGNKTRDDLLSASNSSLLSLSLLWRDLSDEDAVAWADRHLRITTGLNGAMSNEWSFVSTAADAAAERQVEKRKRACESAARAKAA